MADPEPGLRRRWWAAFAIVGGLGIIWALATPPLASPDEPAHVIRAVALTHGQLMGTPFGPETVPPNPIPVDDAPWEAGLAVEVPGAYREWGNIDCVIFDWNAQATPECLDLHGPSGNRRALTHFGRYPPAYYLATGVVSWVTPAGTTEIYVMRIVSALLCAALVASAALTVWTRVRSPIARLGLAAAVTPMALFLFGTVNPSSIEIAAGIGVWVHGAALATAAPDDRDRRVLDRFGVAAVVLVLSRPGSAFALALALAVLAFVAGRAVIRGWWPWRRARIWATGALGALVVQGAWFLHAGTLDVRRTLVGTPTIAPFTTHLRVSAGKELTWLREMIGVFGWLDVPPPSAVPVVWIAALGALGGFALLHARRRVLVGVGVVLVAALLVPLVAQVRLAGIVGYIWQGRYVLPFAVGVPILAAIGSSRAPTPARMRLLVPVVVAALAVAQWLSLAQVLRRYSVGRDGTIWFFTAARWNPPVPSVLLLGAAAALLVAATVVISRPVSRPVHS